MTKAQVYTAVQVYNQIQVLERKLENRRKMLEKVLQIMHPDAVAEYAKLTSEETR